MVRIRTSRASDGGGRLRRVVDAVRALWAWRGRGQAELPYLPLEVSLEVTNRCNFRCSYCRQSDPAHFERVPDSVLTPERAGRLLTKLRQGGLTTSILHWTLDGEPFVNPRFSEILGVAAEHGFNIHHFATNFLLAKPERLRALPREGQSYVLTPDFCSDESLFETHRGTKGSWTRILENLRACLADPELSHVRLKVTDMSAAGIGDEDLLRERFRALKTLLPRSERLSLHRRGIHNQTGRMPTLGGSGRYHGCPHPWFSMAIASSGDVVACCRDLEHETVVGNLFEQDLSEIWNGEAHQALRRDLAAGRPDKQGACAGCDMPYDTERHSLRHALKVAVHRLLLME